MRHRFEPAGVVERTGLDADRFVVGLRRMINSRTAIGAECTALEATVLAVSVPEFQISDAIAEIDIFAIDDQRHAEGAGRLFLAIAAMTGVEHAWLTGYAVADFTALAAAGFGGCESAIIDSTDIKYRDTDDHKNDDPFHI